MIEYGTHVYRLHEMEPGTYGDCFALLVSKDRSTTRDGKPYYRAVFRDSRRSVTIMVWSDTAWFEACETEWCAGRFYKLRGRYFENQYGPQFELERIREATDADRADGFDPTEFHPRTRFDVDQMFAELRELAETEIDHPGLKRLVLELLNEHASAIKTIAAAQYHHHAFVGGYLEHVLSVAQTAVFLANKYARWYDQLTPPLSKPLVVAGAILHDIGKVRELSWQATGTDYTAEGRLIGHILLGRDLVREKGRTIAELDPETLLRLEHIIVAHQGLPEWGSPVVPMTPEALLVHYADDVDAKFHIMALAVSEADQEAEFTSRNNPLKRRLFLGLRGESGPSPDGNQ